MALALLRHGDVGVTTPRRLPGTYVTGVIGAAQVCRVIVL